MSRELQSIFFNETEMYCSESLLSNMTIQSRFTYNLLCHSCRKNFDRRKISYVIDRIAFNLPITPRNVMKNLYIISLLQNIEYKENGVYISVGKGKSGNKVTEK